MPPKILFSPAPFAFQSLSFALSLALIPRNLHIRQGRQPNRFSGTRSHLFALLISSCFGKSLRSFPKQLDYTDIVEKLSEVLQLMLRKNLCFHDLVYFPLTFSQYR
jgi:hypothetical protein